MTKGSYISASEMGEFVYCPRAWWLRINGKRLFNEKMQQGIVAHDNVQKQLTRFRFLRIFLVVLLIISVVFFALYVMQEILFIDLWNLFILQ